VFVGESQIPQDPHSVESAECDSIAHIQDPDAHGLADPTLACMISKFLLPHYFPGSL
jgi:hypothetical protein